jgi:hypothetical protein
MGGENKMELKDTIAMMESPDYKERFKAEYYQLNIRLNKLNDILKKYQNNELGFTLSCSIEALRYQSFNMWGYRNSLIDRAKIEGIEL